MAFESNTYSGICKYKDIDFTFIFSGEELRLVPPADKREIIQMDWVLTPLAKGVYTRGDPLTMDEPYLTGKCNETGTTFVFITKQGGHVGSQNSVLFVPIVAYIRCRYGRGSIARMSFTSPVVNCIHPVTQGFGYAIDVESFNETGVFTVTTQSFDETTTEPQTFMVDNIQVSVEFSISRKLSTKLNEPPITIRIRIPIGPFLCFRDFFCTGRQVKVCITIAGFIFSNQLNQNLFAHAHTSLHRHSEVLGFFHRRLCHNEKAVFI